MVEPNEAYLQDNKNSIAYYKKSSTDYKVEELFAYATSEQVVYEGSNVFLDCYGISKDDSDNNNSMLLCCYYCRPF